MAKEKGWVILRTPDAKIAYLVRMGNAMLKNKDIVVSFDLKQISPLKTEKQKAAIRKKLARKPAKITGKPVFEVFVDGELVETIDGTAAARKEFVKRKDYIGRFSRFDGTLSWNFRVVTGAHVYFSYKILVPRLNVRY